MQLQELYHLPDGTIAAVWVSWLLQPCHQLHQVICTHTTCVSDMPPYCFTLKLNALHAGMTSTKTSTTPWLVQPICPPVQLYADLSLFRLSVHFKILWFNHNHDPLQPFFKSYESLLTLSMHAREGYSSRPVCLSVTLWFWRLLTINSWFRYELTQDEDLRPFIVLLFFISGYSLRKSEAFNSA